MAKAKRNGVDWGSLIIGIMFIITSLISFQNPAGNLVAIVMFCAYLAILKGIFEIVIRNRMAKLTGDKSYTLIILGVINIIIGLFLLFNIGSSVIALPYVFAAWFIIESVLGLLSSGAAKLVSTGYYWFSIAMNILGIILGVMLLYNPLSSALTLSFLVGFYFMTYGINSIVYAFR